MKEQMLAYRYLHIHKRRTMITVAGTAISVLVLFVMMSLAYAYVLMQRDELRAQGDYEIVLLTDSTAVANQVALKEYVVSVDSGYYYHPYQQRVLDDPVLFVKVDQPVKAYGYLQELTTQYAVDGLANEDLLGLYLTGDGSYELVLVLFIILCIYIFALFGVGMIRNAIQFTVQEQIKDFGILCCMGMSGRQLRCIIRRMGIMLELPGIVIGIALAYPLVLVVGRQLQIPVHFYMGIAVLVVVFYLVDLWFVMWENARSVVRRAPMEAVTGQYKTTKDRIKVRRCRWIGRIFGSDGAYAYKSMMRTPGRFYKTVTSVTFAIAAFSVIACVDGTVLGQIEGTAKQYGYYQIYGYITDQDALSDTQLQQLLPDADTFHRLKTDGGVVDLQRMYLSTGYLSNPGEFADHLQSDYRNQTEAGKWYGETDTDGENALAVSAVDLMGLTDADLRQIDENKVEGTLRVDENGIILFNRACTLLDANDGNMEYDEFAVTDYKVGDTVTLADPAALRRLYRERIEDGATGDKALLATCLAEVVAAGKVRTYTIEAVVDDCSNVIPTVGVFALPLEQYAALTGRGANISSGFKCRIRMNGSVKKLADYVSQTDADGNSAYTYSPMSFLLSMAETWRNVSRCLLVVACFVAVMCCLNVVNATSAGLCRRRRELAQLRVLGMSLKRVRYVVVLEGIFTMLYAAVLGWIFGYLGGRLLMTVFSVLLGWEFRFSWAVFLTSVLAFSLVLCGTDYVLAKGGQTELAAELKEGTE